MFMYQGCMWKNESLHILTMALFTVVMATRTKIYLNELMNA